MNWIGIDIGGANLKFAGNGWGQLFPFELWKTPDLLAQTILECLQNAGKVDGLAITMTGELADCFESRQQGVGFICDVVESISNSCETRFYQTNGQFVTADIAKRDWMKTAASNWHATASFVGLSIPHCIVVDVGSTTTDVIPVVDGKVVADGFTDNERLASQELVYTGILRTPVYAVLQHVIIGNSKVELVAENFATTIDVYLTLGLIPENADFELTADGRPATRECAHRRLAKMVCLDSSEISTSGIRAIAEQIYQAHCLKLAQAMTVVVNRVDCDELVLLGTGDWLAKAAMDHMKKSLRIVPFNFNERSSIGPAYAVQQLVQR